MYLAVGETLTLEELLYGLMLSSGNDAALAVAHCVSGTVEDFVAEMQQCADLIRCDLDYVTGSNRVLENLVAGQWKTQFLVLEKGHTVKETDFFPAGEPGRRLLY